MFQLGVYRISKADNGEFLALGRANLADDTESFGMTPLAIRMCRSANGVSAKHGEVSRELWLKMFPDLADAGAVPITSVTNGVHAPTWVAPVFQRLYEQNIGENWHEIVRDEETWATAINFLSDEDIWNTHQQLKKLLIAFIRERTKCKRNWRKGHDQRTRRHAKAILARCPDNRFCPSGCDIQTLGSTVFRSASIAKNG